MAGVLSNLKNNNYFDSSLKFSEVVHVVNLVLMYSVLKVTNLAYTVTCRCVGYARKTNVPWH